MNDRRLLKIAFCSLVLSICLRVNCLEEDPKNIPCEGNAEQSVFSRDFGAMGGTTSIFDRANRMFEKEDNVASKTLYGKTVELQMIKTIAIGGIVAIAGMFLGFVLGKYAGRKSREGGEAGYYLSQLANHIEANV